MLYVFDLLEVFELFNEYEIIHGEVFQCIPFVPGVKKQIFLRAFLLRKEALSLRNQTQESDQK